MSINPIAASSTNTPVQTSVTIERPADNRRTEETRDTDKENLERAEERRVSEARANPNTAPTRTAEGRWVGTTISTVA